MVAPNLALAAVGTEQSTSEGTSSRASSRAPEACPSSVTGWTISGNHIYTGTCSVSGGNISIQTGADITFENVFLTHTGAYGIYNHQILRILNSTIIGGASWIGVQGPSGMTQTKVENSTINGSRWSGIQTNGGKVEIGNSTITPSTRTGIYVVAPTSGFITRNKIINATLTGIYIATLSTTFSVDNNTVTMKSTGEAGTFLEHFSGVYENNTINGGIFFALKVTLAAPKSVRNIRASGSAVGLLLYTIDLDVYDSNFTGNTLDVKITSTNELRMYNSTFKTYSAPDFAGIEVYWKANFSVKWLSNGKGVQGAALSITDVYNTKDPRSLITDNLGRVNGIYIMEAAMNTAAKDIYSPYWFNASITTGGKSYSNSSKGNITNGTNDFQIILDDVPPPLTLISPADGLMTNQTWTIIKAWTEKNVFMDWPITVIVRVDSTDYNPSVGTDGYIEQNVSLSSDGKHTISVKALDSQMNIKMIMINVTRDTTTPVLTLTSPTDGKLTNVSTIDVNGSTEPSANLTVNGVVVPVLTTGAFTYTYHLAEGDNVITISSEDFVHNKNKKVMKVKLDTKPPVLSMIQPLDGYKTNQSTLSIQGTTEELAIVTINNINVPLSGTSFQLDYQLQLGDNILLVKSCDMARNCNISSVHVTLKTSLPSLTITSPTDGNVTNHPDIIVQGTTDLGAKVMINDNSVTVLGTSFSYDVHLAEGENAIKVSSVDEFGNKAEIVITVYRDSVPPALSVNNPKASTTVNTPEITLDGSTELNAALSVNGIVITNSNGVFTKKITLSEGRNYLNVTAVDLAGNKATVSIEVILDTKVSLKVTALSTGTVLETNSTTFNVTGSVDPDAKVYVNDHLISIDPNGNFKTEVQLSLGLNNITVRAEDQNGNKVSNKYQIQRKAVPPPVKPPPVKPPIIPGTDDVSSGGLLAPILVIVALVAAVGVGAGLYMRKRGKEPQTPPVAPTTQVPPITSQAPQNNSETQPEGMQKGPGSPP
jgi:hypothetical protein